MAGGADQLAFSFPHRPALGREDFLVAASNETAVAMIDAWPEWPYPAMVLVGPPGSGKTHLAEVWRRLSEARAIRPADISLQRMAVPDGATAVLIEDLPGASLDEAALFHLINLVHEHGGSLLLTAREFPARWNLGLADLATRLQAAPAIVLEEPDDALLRAVLVKLFVDRQIAVGERVLNYVLMRMERSLSMASELVDELDRLALAEQAPVSLRLAARALEGLAGAPEEK